METKKHQIKELKTQIKQLLSDADSHYKTFGEFVWINEKNEYQELMKSEKFSSLINELTKISSNLEDIERKEDKVVNLKKKIGEILNSVKQEEKRNNEIEGESETHYAGIGQSLFSLFMKNRVGLAELEPYYIETIGLYEKSEKYEEKIEDIKENVEKKLFAKIIETGERTLLSSQLKITKVKISHSFKEAGKKMCKDHLWETSTNSEVVTIFSAFKNNKKNIEDIALNLEALGAEKKNLENEKNDLSKELKKWPASAILKERENTLLTLGKDLYGILAKNDEKAILEEESESIPLIEGIKKDIEKIISCENKIAVLEKEIEIEDLEDEIEKCKKNIKKRKHKIVEIGKEIEDLDGLIISHETNIEDLKAKK